MNERLAPPVMAGETYSPVPAPEFLPVRETAPSKEQYLNRLWFDTVLGVPPPEGNPILTAPDNQERGMFLIHSLRARLEQLPGELGIKTIPGQAEEVSVSALRSFAQPFLEGMGVMGKREKEATERSLEEISHLESQKLSLEELEELKREKERLYINLIRYQLGSLQGQAFSFLPAQAVRNKTMDCSLATAIGQAILDKSGIESSIVMVPGHELLAVPQEEDFWMVYDMVNKRIPPILARRGNPFYDRPILLNWSDPHNEETPYRYFIVEGQDAAANTILGNTAYYLSHPDDYETEEKQSSQPLEDKVVLQTLKSEYPENFIASIRQDLFGPPPSYLGAKEWQQERDRVAEWFKEHPVVAEAEEPGKPSEEKPAAPPAAPPGQPPPAEPAPPCAPPPVPRENAAVRMWRWFKRMMKGLWGWITDDP